MVEIIMYILIFLMGALFGSFFTLAIHRIPLKQDITHERSYCPSCHHKLGFLDLFPLLSYLFLRGKCRYCKKPIGASYFLIELATGLVFLLFAISLAIDFYALDITKCILFGFTCLYFCSLFLLAGIDKEKREIQKSVLVFGLVVEVFYILYLYILGEANVYRYVIYLIVLLILTIFDTILVRKKGRSNYTIQILMLCMYIVLFTKEEIFMLTVIFTLLAVAIDMLLNRIIKMRQRYKKKEQTQETVKPIGFYLGVTNILLVIVVSFMVHYLG